jgi:hypothetical protein
MIVATLCSAPLSRAYQYQRSESELSSSQPQRASSPATGSSSDPAPRGPRHAWLVKNAATRERQKQIKKGAKQFPVSPL